MQAQLQTTFLKAFGDSQSSLQVRKIVIECLLLLVKDTPRVDPIVKELTSLIDSDKINGEQKMEVSEMLALIIRTKGKSIQQAMQLACYNTLMGIMNEADKGGINDKILVNCATALAYLSAYSQDPKQMEGLYGAFDESADGNDALLIPIKLGIIMNGNDTVDKQAMITNCEEYLVDRIVDVAGFIEVDDDPAPVGEGEGEEDEDEIFKFKGIMPLLAHLVNTFGRRNLCQVAGSPGLTFIFECINKSKIISKLAAEDEICADSYKMLNEFLALIPVKTIAAGPQAGTFGNALSQTIKDGLTCIQKFYLNHKALYPETCAALKNLIMLNYDNYLDVVEEDYLAGKTDGKIKPFTKQILKDALTNQNFNNTMTENMKLYANDILFHKK